jgi:mRNA interferase RelE/StbE
MSYNLAFLESALKEWRGLDGAVREQFKKKLAERLVHPRVPKDRLHGGDGNRYKIKLRAVGYRLVYEVRESEVIILVIAVGRRDGADVYDRANWR